MTFSTEIITVIVGQGALSNSVTLLVTDLGFYFISSRVRWIQVEVSDKKVQSHSDEDSTKHFSFCTFTPTNKTASNCLHFFLYV